MKHYFAIVSVFLVVVNCQQSRPPRPPPSMDPKGTPIPMPTTPPQLPVSPPRPKGCSPGCGPTEICAELGASYCRGGQVCSVCIKMSSIRFPASALASMFAQQPQAKPVQPPVPVQPVVQVVPQTNPLNSSLNATLEQMSGATSTIINSTSNETQIPIIEYAAKQRTLLTGIETNSIQDNKIASSTSKGTTTLDLSQMDTQKMKYPIIVTVPDAPVSSNTATKAQNKVVTSNNAVDKSQSEKHFGHIDQTQMTKWYQRYQLFKAQQAMMNGNTVTPNASPDAFDYATFQKFQQWLQQSQNKNQAQGPTAVVETAPTPTVQTPSPAAQPFVQPLGTISQTVITATNEPVQPQVVPQSPTLQEQFLLWQQQQSQQQQQNQPNMLPSQPNAVADISQSTPSASQTNPSVQPAFDYAAFQKQYEQWRQSQSQAQAPAAPAIDYTVLQQQWLKQQQQNAGQNASNNLQTSSQQIQSNTQQNPQTSQQQNTFSYVPQQPVNNFNNDPFAGNAVNNDPFAVNNDPFASNNGMMDMMLFSGLGFGGGLFGF